MCCAGWWWWRQGSVDGSHWVDLRRHVGDATLQLPGQYASWPVTGPAAAVPFRAFRVLLTGAGRHLVHVLGVLNSVLNMAHGHAAL
jgi:hypothetical protein